MPPPHAFIAPAVAEHVPMDTPLSPRSTSSARIPPPKARHVELAVLDAKVVLVKSACASAR